MRIVILQMQNYNQSSDEMRIVKRDGTMQVVSFDKILRRIKTIGSMASSEPIKINYTQLTMKIIDQLYDKISTTKIDELTANQCASMSSIHYDSRWRRASLCPIVIKTRTRISTQLQRSCTITRTNTATMRR